MDIANTPGLDPSILGLPELHESEAPECSIIGTPCTKEGREDLVQCVISVVLTLLTTVAGRLLLNLRKTPPLVRRIHDASLLEPRLLGPGMGR